MLNYKGIYYKENDNNEIKYYEGGAHFKYSSLYKKLLELKRKDFIKSSNNELRENTNEDKINEIEKKKFLKNNNDKILKSLKKISSDKIIENNKINNIFIKNNNLIIIKKSNLKKNFFLKIKNNLKNNNNNNNYDINNKNNDLKDNIFQEDNINIDEKFNIDENIIKLKLRNLSRLKSYRKINIKKYNDLKNSNNSLPKINSFYCKNIPKDNKENNKNNFSDFIGNTNKSDINNNLYNFNNIYLNSNNIEEIKELSKGKSNNKKINKINNKKFSLIIEDKIPVLGSRNKDLPFFNLFSIEKNKNNSLILEKNSINKFNYYNLKESFDKIKIEKNFKIETRNKNLENFNSNTFKKNYNIRNQFFSDRINNSIFQSK